MNTPTPTPKTLYKYASIDAARAILSTAHLRFQSPIHYNDPLDCQWNPFWNVVNIQGRGLHKQLLWDALLGDEELPGNANPAVISALRAERTRFQAMPLGERQSAFEELSRPIHDKLLNTDIAFNQLLMARQRMRALCMSASEQSIQMWSYYSDQHRGVILGFDSATLSSLPQYLLGQVVYRDELPTMVDQREYLRSIVLGTPISLESKQEDRQWMLAKHTGWAHEKEWRFTHIAPSNELGHHSDVPFPRNALVEVIVGCRSDAFRTMEIRSLAAPYGPHVKCFRMDLHPERFELVKKPWNGSAS